MNREAPVKVEVIRRSVFHGVTVEPGTKRELGIEAAFLNALAGNVRIVGQKQFFDTLHGTKASKKTSKEATE